ncbi:hypothetical protein M595_2686 [Lyngbya aestuarii BL J]|uniref:Uncharacterized protein n=1 Tax=Lyngbya aestuarii BL J TaxID=1348334 RepID=U7QHF3_9CYAN|nr:hypothetical protein M595_2686 [Lyngbya aestuarii BL J]
MKTNNQFFMRFGFNIVKFVINRFNDCQALIGVREYFTVF